MQEKSRLRRIPKNYQGTNLTSRQIGDLLFEVLAGISEEYQKRPDLVLAAWPDLIGPKLAGMTRAVSFVQGELLVYVHNATLHSLLIQHEKPRLLENLRKRFPKTEIKNILFRRG